MRAPPVRQLNWLGQHCEDPLPRRVQYAFHRPKGGFDSLTHRGPGGGNCAAITYTEESADPACITHARCRRGRRSRRTPRPLVRAWRRTRSSWAACGSPRRRRRGSISAEIRWPHVQSPMYPALHFGGVPATATRLPPAPTYQQRRLPCQDQAIQPGQRHRCNRLRSRSRARNGCRNRVATASRLCL